MKWSMAKKKNRNVEMAAIIKKRRVSSCLAVFHKKTKDQVILKQLIDKRITFFFW